MKGGKIILFLLCFFNTITTLEDFLEDKFYFQLYPSSNDRRPYYFHIYTHDKKLITINSTDEENCRKIEERSANDYPIKTLSSVISYNKTLLIKTCFGPNRLIEIIDEKNETYLYENNNFMGVSTNLDNIKYCYSTAIVNPQISNEYLIMTYWTEFIIEKGKEKYTHKAILFSPKTKKFSNEIYLIGSSTIIEKLINRNFYARSCITFRGVDIYCSIDLNSNNSYANSFTIDTSKIFTSEPHIHLVISNEDFGKDIFQKPIAIGKELDSIFGGFYDAFLTEYHNEKENKTILVSSLFRKSLFASFISIADKSKIYYGINVEDVYTNQYLFNHLVPNEKELIVIYTMKTGDDMSLIMSRFEFSESNTFHRRFQEFSLSNYLRDDICLKPKHIQSIFVNSFIKYSQNDIDIIENSINQKYYRYQKDIVTSLACENDQKNVYYEYKKIIMPQCLNVLDEINNMDKHYIKFYDESDINERTVVLDIYNDPNLISLRNVTIEFLPINVNLKNKPIIVGVKLTPQDTEYTILSLNEKNTFVNPTHILIAITINYRINKPFSIPYRIKQTKKEGNALKCHLTSDECKFELVILGAKCNIDYCLVCNKLECTLCEDIIGMILKDNQCICDEDAGLQRYPKKFYYNNNDRCICKDNYSFYNNITFCMPNIILENGSYCIFETDETLIPIYRDLKDPTDFHIENGKHYCKGVDPIPEITPSYNDTCLAKNKLWFEYEDIKFVYAKINKCIYIFNENSLFFYSNRNDCSLDNIDRNIDHISKCLNGLVTNDKKKYNEFINNSTEYNLNEENVTIYKAIDNMTFHLGSDQNSNNFSKVEISERCTNLLKNYSNINESLNLLVFIVDIKRNDTRSRQVEFSIYNPEPNKINEKLNLSLCLLDENIENNEKNRRLEELDIITNTSKNINESEILIIPPVDWNEKEIIYIEELYVNNSINLFDPTHPFYNDFCFKYKTPNNSDIYLEDRRKKYYINEILCEDDCTKESYENETQRIVCKCPMKTEPKYINETNFTLTYPFKNKVSAPNIKIMKCPKKAYGGKNGGFYFTFISIIIFVLSYFHRKCIGKLQPLKDLLKIFKGLNEPKEYENLKETDKNENGDNDDDDLDHVYKPKDKKDIPIGDSIKSEEGDIKKDDKKKRPISNFRKKNENNKENNNKKDVDNEITNKKTDELDNNEKNSTKTDELQKSDIKNFGSTAYLDKSKKNISDGNNKNEKNKENNNGETLDKGENINNIQNENDKEEKKGGMHAEVEKDDIKKSIFQLDKSRKEKTEVKTRNHEENRDTNLIDSNRDTNSRKMISENESAGESENIGKKEEKEKKGEKNGKKGKRSKSKKKKIKDDSETKTNDITNENEKNSLDTKNKKKHKSKSKSKKKINLIPSEKDSQSQTNTNKQSEKEIDKLTEGGQIKLQQEGNTYDKDNYDKISNVEDIVAKKRKLKESKDFDAILNEQNRGKKKDNADEDEKEIEFDDPNDPDKQYDLIDNSKEDNKSENSGKKKKHSKKKDKKASKKNKNANPTRKKQNEEDEKEKRSKGSSNKNNRTSFFSEPQEINNANANVIEVKKIGLKDSDRETLKKTIKEDQIKSGEDYLQDKNSNYKSDKRGLLRLIFSMIKNNNTIFFIIFKKQNDLFALVSVIILSLNIYIFLNTFLMFNSSSLHLFIDQDTDLKEKTKGKYFFLNILIPSLLYYITSIIKKMTSIKEFIYDKIYQFEKVSNNGKLNKGEKNIRMHDLITDVSKFKNKKEKDAKKVFLSGIIFLIINWYFITCFLGIYENSYDCLILNVFISLIFTLIFTLIVFIISSILRYLGIKLQSERLFDISLFLNPINNFYNELPYNDSNDIDDEEKEKIKKE